MKIKTTTQWITVALLIMNLYGCGSVRYVSTLKPSGDKTLVMADVRFSIINLDGNDDSLAKRSRELYPNLFTDDWTGLPLEVKTDTKTDSSMGLSAFLTGFCTLGTIPFPGKDSAKINVETSLIGSGGERLPVGKVNYEYDKVMWMTVLSPLGLLPIPGFSDLPRDYIFLPFTGNESFMEASRKEGNYRQNCLVEAVVKTLRTADQAKFTDDYRVRKSRLQEVMIDGKQYWSFLAPSFSPKQNRADRFTALIYQDSPKRTKPPVDYAVVAQRDPSGAWRPVNAYLRMARTLTTVSVLMENNMPSQVVVRAIDEPPLADFIDTPDLSGADRNAVLRWSNNVLLDAKNRSLPKVLREESHEGLLGLVTRTEQSILDLSEKSEQAKDRAQSMVEKGQGDPAPERELAVLLRQRIEVLKPILGAIKQAAAARNQ